MCCLCRLTISSPSPQRLSTRSGQPPRLSPTGIVTFGIRPTGPETGYGYILQGEPIADGVHRVAEFKEKPELPEANRYYRDARYSWNSGMFFFAPQLLLQEFSIAGADIRDGAHEALRRAVRDGNRNPHRRGNVR